MVVKTIQREIKFVPFGIADSTAFRFMTTTQASVDRAFQTLERIKNRAFSGRQQCCHPSVLLAALLTHAPTLSGKSEIASEIINCANYDLVGALIRLTDYFWTSLLVPRIYPAL